MKNKNVKHIVVGMDANYVHKAVIYYESLYEHFKDFHLHVFCFDDVTYTVFKKLNYKNVTIYQTSEFESKKLKKLKKSKERMYEYYWAVNAYITKFVMDRHKPESVTFSDCDYMFFDSLGPIFEEADGADILIQPNNFSFESVNDFVPIGYYCSSFEFFRNNKHGRRVLNWWHKECMKWCSSEIVDGKFGDQKYLDDWRIRFDGVREVANPGANVAPWSVQKYDLVNKKGKVYLNAKWPLIYYHYHSFKMNLANYSYTITGDRNNTYRIDSDVERLVYKPYIKRMIQTIKKLKTFKEYLQYTKENPGGNYHLNK